MSALYKSFTYLLTYYKDCCYCCIWGWPVHPLGGLGLWGCMSPIPYWNGMVTVADTHGRVQCFCREVDLVSLVIHLMRSCYLRVPRWPALSDQWLSVVASCAQMPMTSSSLLPSGSVADLEVAPPSCWPRPATVQAIRSLVRLSSSKSSHDFSEVNYEYVSSL